MGSKAGRGNKPPGEELGVGAYVVGAAFVMLMVLAGAATGGMALRDLGKGLSSADWPTVKGTVTESRTRRAQGRRRTVIRYEYVADMVREEGHRIGFFHGIWGPRSPRSNVERYPVASEVTVRYDPAATAEAILEPGVWWLGFILNAMVSVIMLFLGFLGLRGSVRGIVAAWGKR